MSYRADRAIILLPETTITAAVTNIVSGTTLDLIGMHVCTVQATFVYGSGGTNATAYVQTTFDGGATWMDIMAFRFLLASAVRIHSVRAITAVAQNYTPTDKTLTVDTIKDGLLGMGLRAVYTTTGIYAGGTTLALHAVVQGGL